MDEKISNNPYGIDNNEFEEKMRISNKNTVFLKKEENENE